MRSVEALDFLTRHKVIAVIRMTDPEKLIHVVEAIERGGVKAVEITRTVPGAVEIIRKIAARKKPGFLLGAGTVLDAGSAMEVIEAGAEFVVGPAFNPDMIRACRRRDILVAPGALTPTEIRAAWNEGAPLVKIFPATSLGPQYIRDIHGPFPEIPLLPTGGVSLENARDFMAAGACCLGIGTALLDKTLIAEGRWDELAAKARTLMDSLG